MAEADAGTEGRGTGGQFETVADDVVTTAGLVCWVWVYGCPWNSLDALCWRGRKNRLQSRSSLVTPAKKELGNKPLPALLTFSIPPHTPTTTSVSPRDFFFPTPPTTPRLLGLRQV